MTLQVALKGAVSKDFALDVAFTVGAGITVLRGASGAGKTTVLRAIAGLDRVAGDVRLGDTVWQDDRHFVPPHQRRVGLVFQGIGLLPHLTVRQNLAYAARRAPAGTFVAEDVLARLALMPMLDRLPARLSGGEAQRANIARALLSQPHVLLMDEPLSALDDAARGEVFAGLQALLAHARIPTLYVTHNGQEAAMADAEIRVDAGRV